MKNVKIEFYNPHTNTRYIIKATQLDENEYLTEDPLPEELAIIAKK